MYNTSNHLKSLFFPLALFETGGYMYAVAIFMLVDGGEGGCWLKGCRLKLFRK